MKLKQESKEMKTFETIVKRPGAAAMAMVFAAGMMGTAHAEFKKEE